MKISWWVGQGNLLKNILHRRMGVRGKENRFFFVETIEKTIGNIRQSLPKICHPIKL